MHKIKFGKSISVSKLDSNVSFAESFTSLTVQVQVITKRTGIAGRVRRASCRRVVSHSISWTSVPTGIILMRMGT